MAAKISADESPKVVPKASVPVDPDAPANVAGFENRVGAQADTVQRLAPQHQFEKNQRLERIVLWAARYGGQAAAIASMLWLSSCATTSPTATGRARTSSLPKPPSDPMSQLAYPKDWLGNGKYRTIAEAGCFLTSLAMASEALTDKDWDPVTANAALKKGGGFSGAAIDLDDATRVLGLQTIWRGRLTKGSLTKRHGQLDEQLRAGRVAIASVDIMAGSTSGESEGDHFIMIYKKQGDAYCAVDPIGGRLVELTPNADGFLAYGQDHSHRICELCFLRAR